MKIRHIPLLLVLLPHCSLAIDQTDLPLRTEVEAALDSHINVLNAKSGIQLALSEQYRLESGPYEFNLRGGAAQRKTMVPGQAYREWDVAIERPIRMPNKIFIDYDIGAETLDHAQHVLGDARHEAGRNLLRLWFNWQREQTQTEQWQQQIDLLKQQAVTTEKRLLAGDAPRMELSQANAAVAQASVALQQATMRTELARNELLHNFPGIHLPAQLSNNPPHPITGDLETWRQTILDHNHELAMASTSYRVMQKQAERSSADRIPDPTIGVRYSSEVGGREKVAGVYLSVPLSFGIRGSLAESASQQAEMAGNQEQAVRRRLEADIYATYTLAVRNYEIWKNAKDAADSIRRNTELVARAYSLGESSLSETLTARRLALESSLAESLARLDANQAHYRLLLDAHQLWKIDDHGHEAN